MAIQIGIELEMLNVTGNEVIEAWNEAGVDHCPTIYGYHQGPACTSGKWKMERDSSLTGSSCTYNTKGCIEVISPILNGAVDIRAMNRFITAVNRKGAKVDSSCGTHISVGLDNKARFNNMSNEAKFEVANRIVRAYQHFSDIFDGMSPNVRSMRNNYYVGYPTTIDRNSAPSKMKAVNLKKFIQYGVIEFRQPGYTLDKKKIKLWLKIINKLISMALNENHVSHTMNLEDMPRDITGFSTYLGLSNMVETMLRDRVQQLHDNHQRGRDMRARILGRTDDISDYRGEQ